MSNQAKQSKLLKSFDIRTIYNNINSNDFYPINKRIARDILGINTEKRIILAGAQNLKDFYKGFDKFLEAVDKLDREKYYLVFLETWIVKL